jgi:hypothetical protein
MMTAQERFHAIDGEYLRRRINVFDRVMQIGAVAALISMGSGCATVIEGGDQVINVSTTGCEEHGAMQCVAKNDDGSSVLTAPASVSMDKDKDSLVITCNSKDGEANGEVIIDSKYEAWNAGNILVGGIIGVGVDAATGAMWKYPSAVVVPMKCDASGEAVEEMAESNELMEAAAS